MTITDEPSPEEELGVVLDAFLPGMDRYLTDYKVEEVQDAEVCSRPSKLVRATYRQGRVTVALDQWMIPTDRRLVAISASYDIQHDRDFFDTASGVVDTLVIL